MFVAKKNPSGLLAATLCPFAGSSLYPKICHHSTAGPLNICTPLAGYMPKGPQNQSNSAQAAVIFLSCVTFPAGELSAGSANGIPMAVFKALPQVLVLHLTPALLVHSWLTPDFSAQPASQAPRFYFSLACSL